MSGEERPAPASPYASLSATRAVLDEHGLAAKKSLGQNFLVNDHVVAKILDLAQVGEGDRILEVGPGIGTLTAALLTHAASVVSVERDPDLPPVLAHTLRPWKDRFALIEKDALDLTIEDVRSAAFGEPDKLVANLPYAVAATVVLDYFERFGTLESATVMVQKEVADRMAATPGNKNYGAYTVKLSLFACPAGRFEVAPGNFFPAPHVDSTVLRLNRRVPVDADGAPLPPEVVRAACLMADAAFVSRRKTLANSCKTYFAGKASAKGTPPLDPARLPLLFAAADINPSRRGETLTTEEFIKLGRAYLCCSQS